MFLLSLAILALPTVLRGPQSAHAQHADAEPSPGDFPGPDASALHEALFYDSLPGGEAECRLCPRRCLLKEGETGDCRVRRNIGGKLYTLNYGRPIVPSLEPIEKAPFYHFMPGHVRLCVATVGCNLRCKYCQNWHLSQRGVEDAPFLVELTPRELVDLAVRGGAESICFTFSEPISFYEYMVDTARIARERGLKTSMVSAGYINEQPLKMLLEVLDAVKIDLKAFTEEFYEDIVYGELQPVLDTLKQIRRSGKWLEIVNLVVPTLNDDPRQLAEMCTWIRENLGPDVPIHFTRFHPTYRLTNLPPTPVESLETAHRIAREAGLRYVYVGNVPGHELNHTYCPVCGRKVIERVYFTVTENLTQKGRCPFCGSPLAGLGLAGPLPPAE